MLDSKSAGVAELGWKNAELEYCEVLILVTVHILCGFVIDIFTLRDVGRKKN